MDRFWKTSCLGVEAEKSSKEGTSGSSNRILQISLGACCRWAQDSTEAAGEETAERTSRESVSKTLAQAKLTNKV